MLEHNGAIQEFLQTACNQIRYKSIHKSIVNELTDHIEEQKIHYIKLGFSEEEATAKAIEQMGDPVLVGKELDKAHRPKTEWSILSLVAVLVLIGGALQFLISGVSTDGQSSFLRFLFYAPIGIAVFTFTYFFDYTLIARYSKQLFFILFGTAIVYFYFSQPYCGAYPHIYYFALLFIPIFAGVIYSYKGKDYFGIIKCGLYYGSAAFLCLIAPRVSAFVIHSVSCLILLTLAIIKGYFIGNKKISLAIVYIPTTIIFILFTIFLFFQSPIRRNRIATMLNPKIDPDGQGFHVLMVKRIIQSSQTFGKAVFEGEFENMPIHQMLPGWNTDFSLTYIIGRLGIAAGLIIIAIVSVFIVRMFISVTKQKNSFGYLLSFSACIALTSQFVLYVISNLGIFTIFPSLTLPFISFGGMGFIANMVLIGLVLSVYRRTNIVYDRIQMNSHNLKLFTFEDGKIIIDLGLNKDKNHINSYRQK
jgi:cell division protein FtsW (lipid II flippase)